MPTSVEESTAFTISVSPAPFVLSRLMFTGVVEPAKPVCTFAST